MEAVDVWHGIDAFIALWLRYSFPQKSVSLFFIIINIIVLNCTCSYVCMVNFCHCCLFFFFIIIYIYILMSIHSSHHHHSTSAASHKERRLSGVQVEKSGLTANIFIHLLYK